MRISNPGEMAPCVLLSKKPEDIMSEDEKTTQCVLCGAEILDGEEYSTITITTERIVAPGEAEVVGEAETLVTTCKRHPRDVIVGTCVAMLDRNKMIDP